MALKDDLVSYKKTTQIYVTQSTTHQSSRQGPNFDHGVLTTQDNGSSLLKGALPSLNPPATKSKVGFQASGGYRSPYSGVLEFREVQGNEGNYFNPSTGFFTAPVKGMYRVSIAIAPIGFSSSKRVDADVYRLYNQSLTVYSLEDFHGGSKTFVVYMDAGDQIFAMSEYLVNCGHFSCSLL
ncbi:uncharacterized protein LOC131936284 [Physella acuta]|uniref:uncharacterized protein LOC131936284 n=1 Tax=Physella acuta TaxID=109671 RepID=UPI0027DC7777|nr:uncharacterized protein LOC131936284 [Physella acuta]